MSVRSIPPPVQSSSQPRPRTARRVVRRRSSVCARACMRARASVAQCSVAQCTLPKRFPVARGDGARKLMTGPLGRSGLPFCLTKNFRT